MPPRDLNKHEAGCVMSTIGRPLEAAEGQINRTPMTSDSTIQTFRSVLENAIGTARGINDGGNECGGVFVLDQSMLEENAEKLAQWWNDKYGDDGIELTNESAIEFLEETYPETDETSRGCK